MKLKLLFYCGLLLFSYSCANMKSFQNNKARGAAGIVRVSQFSEKESKEGTFLWSYYDATKRGSVMYVKDGKIRVLSENSPDAAIQSLTAITAKANIIGKVDASAALNTQRTIAQLGKRTAAVNMLRDALYRLNEMYYATVDQQSELKKLLDSNKISQETYKILMTTNAGAGTKTLDKSELSEMFKLIIQETKAISIAEADAEKITVKAESDASIEKSKEQQKKHDAIIAVIQKMEGNLTKEKAEEYLKDLIKN